MSTSSVGGGSRGGSDGGSSGGGGGGPCGACKFLRRKCVSGCIFAPYFHSEQGASHFAAVHKVFGGSNVSKLLLHIPAHKRLDAILTICYQAQARLHDPVYGCVAHIFALQQQVVNLQADLTYLQAHLATLEHPSPPPPVSLQTPFSISDLPSVSNLPSALSLSVSLDPIMVQPQWALQQQQLPVEIRQQLGASSRGGLAECSSSSGGIDSSGGGDIQELERELLDRHLTGHPDHHYHHPPCTK